MAHQYLRQLNIDIVDGDFKVATQEQVRSPEQVWRIFSSMKDWAHKTVLVVYMFADLRPSAYRVLRAWSANDDVVSPKEIFGVAFALGASYFLLIHNHPSGDETPTTADEELMRTLRDADQLSDIEFLDFIVVGHDSYWSMFDQDVGGGYRRRKKGE